MKAIIGLIGMCICLSGCASPSFRGVVYENISNSAQVLMPKGYPRLGYYTNSYRFPPGSIVTASTAQFSNPFSRTAGQISEVDNQCFQQIYLLHQMGPVANRIEPVNVSYRFDASIAAPFSQVALTNFREDNRLRAIPDNVLTYIREVTFKIDKIRVYEPSPEQLRRGIKDASIDCSFAGQALNSMVVRKVYVGNVKSYTRWDKGGNAELLGLKALVQESLRKSYDGVGVIFAVETAPLSSFSF